MSRAQQDLPQTHADAMQRWQTQGNSHLPAPSLSMSTNSLFSDHSALDAPPKIQIFGREHYASMPWKNGLGETAEVAIYPAARNFRRDPFVWRLSLSDVRDSCSFSLFPGYDITLFLLPDASGASQAATSAAGSAGPAVLHHNDHATPIAVKPLVPYTYRGEWPTTCRINVSPLRHITFILNRRLATASIALETLTAHGDDGDDADESATPVDTNGVDADSNRSARAGKTVVASLAASSRPVPQTPPPEPLQSASVSNSVQADGSVTNSSDTPQNIATNASSADAAQSPDAALERVDKLTSTSNRLLTSSFTILFVVSGAIAVNIEGDSKQRIITQGQTLICERDEEGSPADLKITPINPADAIILTRKPTKDSAHAASMSSIAAKSMPSVLSGDEPVRGRLAKHHDATVLMIHIHKTRPVRQGSLILESPTLMAYNPGVSSTALLPPGMMLPSAGMSSASFPSFTSALSPTLTSPIAAAAFVAAVSAQQQQQQSHPMSIGNAGRPPRARTGSIIVYDDQPLFTVPREMEGQMSFTEGTSPVQGTNLALKHWESAHVYRPPVFSMRYKNESEVPPPVTRDSLVIEEFPMGKISTVWINVVKQGLSEWIRVPVIVARGAEPGPVVGITAVVHGNELNGVPCIHRVITDIDVRKLKGTVVAVPCVNVPGYLRFTREFSDGRDLNRLFPGQENGTASQVYNYNMFVKIINHFNYLIDLHTASFGRVNSYYVRADMNDPVTAVLAKLQQPQIILHNSGQDGTLRSAASARDIKAITVEIGNPQLFQNQYVQWSYMGVMRILSYLNMFRSEEADMNAQAAAANASQVAPAPNTVLCSKGFWIYTRTGGVLEVYPNVNSLVRKGDLIARIKNIFGNIVDEIFATSSGVTIGRSSNPVAMAGDRVLHMGIVKKENEALPKEAKENY